MPQSSSACAAYDVLPSLADALVSPKNADQMLTSFSMALSGP